MYLTAEIINRKRRSREILFWAFSFGFLFIFILPSLLMFSIDSFGLIGSVICILFLPITAVLYPFSVIIGGLGGFSTFVFHFILVIFLFVLMFNAWTYTKLGNTIIHSYSRITFKETLSTIPKFYVWIWLTWIEYLFYFILYACSPLYVLLSPIRQITYTLSLKSKIWAKDHPTFFTGLIFIFYLQVAVAIPGLVYSYVGKEYLFEGIIGAIAIISFVSLQFQKITLPCFIPVFVEADRPLSGDGKFETIVSQSTVKWLYISIINLGLTTFKNCVFEVTFPKGFEIVSDKNLYVGKDFSKTFNVRDDNTTIEFLPIENYLTFSPCTTLTFPIAVLVPDTVAEYRIITSLTSESAWGVQREPLRIIVSA